MLELLSFGNQGWGDEILLGAGVTVLLAISAFALGLVLGTLGAAAKLSPSAPVRWGAEVYTTVFRGVPELLVIYLFAFGSAGAIMSVAGIFGYTGYLELPPFLVGVLAVGIISGAYSTEVIRGAIQSVPQGQIEAAMAVGMHRRQIFFRITLPQLLRFALPGLGNVWQLTLKDTALVSVAALAELMRISRVASDSTREPFLFYVTAAVLYLVMTTGSQVLFQLAERRAARGVRTA
ncbi:ABC transporter permease [Fodinicurvata sp. EGI_FJ10296]|uniref:ABC transporter permease n=1 Tax=Fodinicurvata sp. EGI_FJ10296 TaxID=3231908 RepID=UPI003456FB9B